MTETTLYEDALIKATLPEKGAVHGHIVITPQRDVTTTDELKDDEIEHLSFGASLAATVLFETLGAQGTNMILVEDEPKLHYDIIARKQDDGFQHQWTPQQLDQTVMDDAQDKIKDNTPLPGQEEKEQPAPVATNASPETTAPATENTKDPASLKAAEEKENYLIRQLKRVP